MTIAQNLADLKHLIPPSVKLIAVSKTKPNSAILEAYASGQRVFGENYVQEIVDKQKDLPEDIEWHFIGHLQSNKAKNIAPFVSYIHAVHSIKLLDEIQKQAEKNNRQINCLLQFHIAQEETKYGFRLDSYEEALSVIDFSLYPNIVFAGVMGMASFVTNQRQIESEFQLLKDIFENLKTGKFAEIASFKEISMGMSGDWPLAVEKGSTMVRIGSAIFGNR
ncbi:MAG: YggS family pyridoxal phosphate-dependent enzyme [Flavobacteriales bacterium]